MNHCNSSDQEWTYHENMKFENAIAELDHNSPNFFQKINAIFPCKSVAQIKSHYEKLVANIEMIESGEICTPKYDETKVVDVVDDHKRKGAQWTDEEHRWSFLVGLNKLGKGEWRAISGLYVQTKTPAQVASHGKKYYRRVKCRTPVGKRRYSIHDIRVLNSNIVETSARQPTHHSLITHIPQHGHPSIKSAPYLNAQPQMLQQDNVCQQQYNICQSSWAELANTKYPNLYGNNMTQTTCNITGSSNNNSQMMMANHGNNYTDYGDQGTNYVDLFPESQYWFTLEEN